MKTQNWKITISILIVFLSFFTIYLLVGEVDFLNLNWIVAHNAELEKVTITNENFEHLKNKYPTNFALFNLEDVVDKTFLIKNVGPILINSNILILIFSVFCFFLVLPLLLIVFKFCNWDYFVFILTVNITCLLLFFVDLIPNWGSNTNNDNVLRFIVILAIEVTIAIFIFIFLNWIFNLFFINNSNSSVFADSILQEDKEVLQSKNEISSLMSVKKKETFIEIDDTKK